MMPTAHEVAVAIVAASKELGADPIETLTFLPESNYERDRRQRASRARAYAARAIDKVFNRPTVVVPRPVIARMIGASKVSQGAYFAALDGRPLPWWDDAVLKRVVDAVMECEPSAEEKPKEPPPYKHGPLPPVRPLAIGKVAVSTAPVVRGGHGAPRTRLNAFADAGGLPNEHHSGGAVQLEKRARERGECRDILAEAAANTAKLQAKLAPETED